MAVITTFIVPCLSLESVDVKVGKKCKVSVRLAVLGTSMIYSGDGKDWPRAAATAISVFLRENGLAEITLTYSRTTLPPATTGRFRISYRTSAGYDGGASGETLAEAVEQMVFYCLRNSLKAQGVSSWPP